MSNHKRSLRLRKVPEANHATVLSGLMARHGIDARAIAHLLDLKGSSSVNKWIAARNRWGRTTDPDGEYSPPNIGNELALAYMFNANRGDFYSDGMPRPANIGSKDFKSAHLSFAKARSRIIERNVPCRVPAAQELDWFNAQSLRVEYFNEFIFPFITDGFCPPVTAPRPAAPQPPRREPPEHPVAALQDGHVPQGALLLPPPAPAPANELRAILLRAEELRETLGAEWHVDPDTGKLHVRRKITTFETLY